MATTSRGSPRTARWPRRLAPAGWVSPRGCIAAGQTQHLPVLKEALADPSRTVRYYAAFQLGGPGGAPAEAAVPLLKRIVAEEKDPDLVDRAKLSCCGRSAGAGRGPARRRPPRAGADRGHGDLAEGPHLREAAAASPRSRSTCPSRSPRWSFKSLPDDAQQRARAEGLRRRQLLGTPQEPGPQRRS